jgi:hypothetical protein
MVVRCSPGLRGFDRELTEKVGICIIGICYKSYIEWGDWPSVAGKRDPGLFVVKSLSGCDIKKLFDMFAAYF